MSDLGERLAVAALLGPAFLLLAEVDHLRVLARGRRSRPRRPRRPRWACPPWPRPRRRRAARSKVSLPPTSPSSSSTLSLSPWETRYCFPPVWITAYIGRSFANNHRNALGFLPRRELAQSGPGFRKGGSIRSPPPSCQGNPEVTLTRPCLSPRRLGTVASPGG